ncbi:hypothetical protein GCM10010912_07170 [Paenibacillus albidus]|uniref:N-acetyltransferase domain-containing protein n=2 Tax=Paenibacillus albidus TaxID=2041023 RepID=A0A917FC10_9BACL|nr:hypothetical protein GCM10010912_07170 [Paenibacillus albidus]
MIYRDMNTADYDAAYELWENTEGMGLSSADAREEITLYLERNSGISQVCVREDGTLAGTALCGHDGRRGYMYHVAVSGDCRGLGVGRALVARCLDRLREQGIVKCHLMVIAGNEQGQGFWAGLGWQRRDGILLYSQDV